MYGALAYGWGYFGGGGMGGIDYIFVKQFDLTTPTAVRNPT